MLVYVHLHLSKIKYLKNQIKKKSNNIPQVLVFDVFEKMVQHYEDVVMVDQLK